MMSVDTVTDRLKYYTLQTKQAEENALKEICQEIALAGLSRSHFFNHAMFQGGTCLRIVHGLKRFSEDLDFILNIKNDDFQWSPYLQAIETEFRAFGLSLEVIDRSQVKGPVKKAFLKESSFGKLLALQFSRTAADSQKILIKLEIDTDPPAGSISDTHFLDYPYPFSITTQDLTSLFAGKCHALLCRNYVKGRDWFDFIWYIQHKIQINYVFLQNGINQVSNPYQQDVVNKQWLIQVLKEKINTLDWTTVANDVKKFLSPDLIHTVEHWNTSLFLAMLSKLEAYL